jgi:hypothetical protein
LGQWWGCRIGHGRGHRKVGRRGFGRAHRDRARWLCRRNNLRCAGRYNGFRCVVGYDRNERGCPCRLRQCCQPLNHGRSQAGCISQRQRDGEQAAARHAERYAPDYTGTVPRNIHCRVDFLGHARIRHEHAARHHHDVAVIEVDGVRCPQCPGLIRAAMRAFFFAVRQRVSAAMTSRVKDRRAKR